MAPLYVARRKLNQAISKHIVVVNEEVVGAEINRPLPELLAAQHGFRSRTARLSKADSLDQTLAELGRGRQLQRLQWWGYCAITAIERGRLLTSVP